MVALKSRLTFIAASLPSDAKRILKEGAEEIKKTARSKVPVGTGKHAGRLRDSITVYEYEYSDKVGYRVRAEARSDNNFPYGFLVEYGSVNNRVARPFLTPALEEHRDDILKALGDAVEEI